MIPKFVLQMNSRIISIPPEEDWVFQMASIAFRLKVDSDNDIRKVRYEIKSTRRNFKQKYKQRLSLKRYKARLKVKRLKRELKKFKKSRAESKVMKKKALRLGGDACRDRIMRGVFGLGCDYCHVGKQFLTVTETGSFCCGCINRGDTTRREPTDRVI